MALFKTDQIAKFHDFVRPLADFSRLDGGGKREGLELKEILAIAELARQTGQTPMADLGAALGLSTSGTTRLVAKLTEKDIFASLDDPNNRRRKLVVFTEQGINLLRLAGLAH